MWMSNCLWNTLIRNAVMYLISHPLMVLPLLRITQGKKRAGGTGAWRERRGQSLELLFGEREQDLRKTEERERGNQELYKERWGARVHNRKEEFKKSYVGSGKSERVRRKRVISEWGKKAFLKPGWNRSTEPASQRKKKNATLQFGMLVFK